MKKDNLDKEELDRLKISFAEGYLVARDQKGTTKTKWWKIIQSSILVGLCLATLVSLFGNIYFHYKLCRKNLFNYGCLGGSIKSF